MGQTDRPNMSYPPLPLVSDLAVVESEPDQRYLTKRYTEKAVEFIRASAEGPFFLYLPHTMPHWPQYASEDFAGKSKNGKWGDAVEEIDWSTGVILDTLEELKIADNTLVVFMSDNGGAMNHGAKNTPLKGGKGSTFEGGMRVCGIVRWPGHVPAGETCDQLLTSMDWLPTFARIAGTKPPQDRIIDGRDISEVIVHPDSAKTPHEHFFYYWMSYLECVRSGDWKLRVASRKGRESVPLDKPQLFNLRGRYLRGQQRGRRPPGDRATALPTLRSGTRRSRRRRQLRHQPAPRRIRRRSQSDDGSLTARLNSGRAGGAASARSLVRLIGCRRPGISPFLPMSRWRSVPLRLPGTRRARFLPAKSSRSTSANLRE